MQIKFQSISTSIKHLYDISSIFHRYFDVDKRLYASYNIETLQYFATSTIESGATIKSLSSTSLEKRKQ